MSVSPLRRNSKNSKLLYLHVWQILNKIILFLTVLSVKLPRVILRNLENALIACSAFLLFATNRVIGRKKITNQNTFKVFQHLLKERTFTALLVQIDDVMQIGEDPNVSGGAFDTYLCLIHMQQTSVHEMTKDGVVG